MGDEFLINAAVLVPVYRGPDGKIRVVLIRRSASGVHGGQMAFPGGRPEACDASVLETALREAEEEIGLPRQSVVPVLQLPDVVTQASCYRITPFLARITPPSRWACQAEEVDCVVDVSLEELVASYRIENTGAHSPTGTYPFEYYLVGQDKIWGATYRILAPLVERLKQGEFRF